jgi:hypothetical protein
MGGLTHRAGQCSAIRVSLLGQAIRQVHLPSTKELILVLDNGAITLSEESEHYESFILEVGDMKLIV